MALAVWQATIVDASGDVQAEAEITVLREVAGQPPAQCYSDRDGTDPIGSTFNADGDGFVRFFVEGGAYQIKATLGAFSRVWRYVAIGRAAETDAGFLPTSIPTVFGFDDATADADPGSGLFRLNNATPASATAIYIDNNNGGGTSVSAWLDTFDDGGDSANRGMLTICDPDQVSTVFRVYQVSGSVVDGTGYRKLTVTHIAGAGSFTEGVAYSITFHPKGNEGAVPASRTLTAGAGLTGGGTLAADRTFDVGAGTGIVANANDVAIDKASDANVRAAASNKVLTSDLIESAAALVSLSSSSNATAVDWDSGVNFTLTLSENTTISNPTNGQPGTWRTIYVVGNDGTDRTISFGNQFLGQLPTLTTIDNANGALLMIYCRTSTHFVVSAKDAL
jgi:hypothetical protein